MGQVVGQMSSGILGSCGTMTGNNGIGGSGMMGSNTSPGRPVNGMGGIAGRDGTIDGGIGSGGSGMMGSSTSPGSPVSGMGGMAWTGS